MNAAGEAVRVRIKRLERARDLPLPETATGGAAGFDLRASVEAPVVLDPGGRAVIPTGIALEIPPGFEGQVRARSGLAARYGISLLNGPGTVDSDYRGEVRVILGNLGADPFTVRRGDRIAQLVIQRVPRVEWEEVDELPSTERGAGGFGHTGSH